MLLELEAALAENEIATEDTMHSSIRNSLSASASKKEESACT
jgi:hypothetical protein